MDHCGPDGDQRDRRSLLTIVDQSGPATVMAEIVDEGTIVDQSGPATVMGEIVDEGTIVDQSGPATVIVDEGTIVDQSGPATVMAAHTHTRTHAHTHTRTHAHPPGYHDISQLIYNDRYLHSVKYAAHYT